jgi:intracellular sulfur oxidation DsrE/DsrF family protein
MVYLKKHEKRMQYADYKEDNLMCGSGIVESGVRRIINLRFKNTSAFWDAATVEKLYFLRAAVLSKRWNVVIQNLAN